VREAPPPEPEREDPGPTTVSSEVGGLDEYAMGKAFDSLEPRIEGCVGESKTAEHEVFGGHFTLSLRIALDGSTRWAYLSESTLGDRETEKCILALAEAQSWPPPLGGEGLAQRSFDILPPRAPMELESKRLKKAILQVTRETARCRHGHGGAFVATAYLHPTGKVMAAGVAPPDENAEQAADCVVEAIERLRFGAIGRRPAKVSFEVPYKG
jgi:hypothetical protein